MTDTRQFVLWGFHPGYKGADGFPYPLPLARGNLRECNGEQRRRKKQSRYWMFGTYLKGDPPTGLRLVCDEKYPGRSRLGET